MSSLADAVAMTRILTVDDSATIRSIITKNLTELGYEIEQAEDGAQGLAKLEEIEVDLVLLDVTMPVMDGPTMLEKLRASGNKTPVIMLTSESKRTIVSGAVKLGIEDYILKPFKPEELRAKVQKALKADPQAGVPAISAAPAAPTASSAPAAGRQFIDILIVDDMENVHKKLRSLLPEQTTLNGVTNARDAIQHCQERVYRVIVIDLVIPDVNSVVLMNQLRVLQPHAVMTALTLKTSSDQDFVGQGFHDGLYKPFDGVALDEWRAKYFEVGDLLEVADNVLSCAEFTGKQGKIDSYFSRLKGLCPGSFEKLASACYEDAIVDLNRVPMHNDKVPRLVADMVSEATKFGINLRIVGSADTKKALAALVETASLPFFASVGEAKAA
jgi:two-component system, cell cycle response regulator